MYTLVSATLWQDAVWPRRGGYCEATLGFGGRTLGTRMHIANACTLQQRLANAIVNNRQSALGCVLATLG